MGVSYMLCMGRTKVLKVTVNLNVKLQTYIKVFFSKIMWHWDSARQSVSKHLTMAMLEQFADTFLSLLHRWLTGAGSASQSIVPTELCSSQFPLFPLTTVCRAAVLNGLQDAKANWLENPLTSIFFYCATQICSIARTCCWKMSCLLAGCHTPVLCLNG